MLTNELNGLNRRALDNNLYNKKLDRPIRSPKILLSTKSIQFTSPFSKNLLKRIRRSELLINNELATGISSHDSNTFQPNGESSFFNIYFFFCI